MIPRQEGSKAKKERERLQVYSLSPSAIGARYGYILSTLPRLVPVTGIFSLPFRDWCPLRHALKRPESSDRPIRCRMCGYILTTDLSYAGKLKGYPLAHVTLWTDQDKMTPLH
eukprot:1192421-Prorocentrum_minimum.AAC.1